MNKQQATSSRWGLWIVWCKEVRENLRDRRALLNALLIGPLLSPLLLLMITHMVLQRETREAEQPLNLPVIGARYAPDLIDFMAASGIHVQVGPADPVRTILSKDQDAVLRISSDYSMHLRNGERTEVELFYDSSRSDISSEVNRVRGLIQAYAGEQAGMRLIARGISPVLAHPIMVAERDQSTPQSRASLLFGMLPYLLILTIQTGGIYLAIDLTAGERERHSLEPLLINPVPRWQIFIGKWGATCTFATASMLLSLIAFANIGYALPTDTLGIELHFGFDFMLLASCFMLPLLVGLAALQMLVASFAKSYREAQTYLGLLSLLPALPSLLLSVFPIKSALWMYTVPVLSQNLTITELLRTGHVGLWPGCLCVAGSLAIAGLILAVGLRAFNAERMAISA